MDSAAAVFAAPSTPRVKCVTNNRNVPALHVSWNPVPGKDDHEVRVCVRMYFGRKCYRGGVQRKHARVAFSPGQILKKHGARLGVQERDVYRRLLKE
jgi:hypothetical protein